MAIRIHRKTADDETGLAHIKRFLGVVVSEWDSHILPFEKVQKQSNGTNERLCWMEKWQVES